MFPFRIEPINKVVLKKKSHLTDSPPLQARPFFLTIKSQHPKFCAKQRIDLCENFYICHLRCFSTKPSHENAIIFEIGCIVG